MDATTIPANTVSFRDFLFKDKRNRTILILAAVAMVIQWGVFKWFYPFASFIHGDSFSYLSAAYHNFSINTYMVGYSNFLRFVSLFTKSDLIFTFVQYLLIETSVLFLLFTTFYFYIPGKVIRLIALVFMVCNPLFLHLANLVSSDGYFLALSMIWMGTLLWIIHKPSIQTILIHFFALYLAFTTRYNALIYPVISVCTFCLSKMPLRKKLAGMAGCLLVCGVFIIFTMYQYKKLTGVWQYSPFSGWQLANNAMYTFRYVAKNERKPVPKKFMSIHNMVCEYFDSTRDLSKNPVEKIRAGTFYMWTPKLSLMKYQDSIFRNNDSATKFIKWASMGPYYKDYGSYIIKQYPWHFIKYFVWPNVSKYYAPPIEFLQNYNSGRDSVATIAKDWFNYKNEKVYTRFKNPTVTILEFYPIMSGIINVIMLCSLISFVIMNGWRQRNPLRIGVLFAGFIWLLNALFTMTASSAALRFQAFPIIMTTTFALLLIDWFVAQLSVTHKNEDYKMEAKTVGSNPAEPGIYELKRQMNEILSNK
jgi:hypothetical protein